MIKGANSGAANHHVQVTCGRRHLLRHRSLWERNVNKGPCRFEFAHVHSEKKIKGGTVS